MLQFPFFDYTLYCFKIPDKRNDINRIAPFVIRRKLQTKILNQNSF
jgi:hypothetical protein